MKGRILVTFLMFTMVFIAFAFISTIKPHAQSIGHSYTPPDLDRNSAGVVDIPLPEQTQSTGPGNIVYVGDNLSTGAGIKIFRRSGAMGILTEMPNSPQPTGGKGAFDVTGFNRAPTGIFAATDIGPFEHDGNMIITPDRKRIFVVNQGSDDISVLDVSDDGLTLTPVPGSPFKTGPVPSSVTIVGDTVVVLNKNDRPGNPKPIGAQASLQSYKLAANGSLTPVPNSEIKLPSARPGEGLVPGQTTSPSQVLAVPGTSIFFLNEFMGGMIRPYKVNPDGTMKASPAFDVRSLGLDILPANGPSFPFTLGLGLYPGKNILYSGLVFENKVAVFTFNPKNGKLKYITNAVNSGSTVCWFAMRNDGRYMWTSNQASNSVSTYDLADPLKPVEVQHIFFQGCGEPSWVSTDPMQNWIHFVNSAVTNKCSQKDPNTRANIVHTLRIAPDGRLTELYQPDPMMNVPLGERIEGVVTK